MTTTTEVTHAELFAQLRKQAHYLVRQTRSTHAGNRSRQYSRRALAVAAERFKGVMNFVAHFTGGIPQAERDVDGVDIYAIYLDALKVAGAPVPR